MSERTYARARTICCAQMGVSWWDFDDACNDGRVALEDVCESILYARSTPILGENISLFLHREQAIQRKTAADALQQLTWHLDKTRDPEQRAKLKTAIDRIQRNPRTVKLKRA